MILCNNCNLYWVDENYNNIVSFLSLIFLNFQFINTIKLEVLTWFSKLINTSTCPKCKTLIFKDGGCPALAC